MKTQKNKVVFIEYSTAEKGQHFMTVINYGDGKRKIIGRVFREYDKENKTMSYGAKDWAGNPIFTDTEKLYELKKKFIENGKTMADSIPDEPFRKEEEEIEPFTENTERGSQVKEIRKRKTEKEKEKVIER